MNESTPKETSKRRKNDELYSPEFTERMYRFIKDYWRTTGKTPSFRAIGQYLSFNSTTCIYYHLNKLKIDGRVIDTDPIKIDKQLLQDIPETPCEKTPHATSPRYFRAESK